MKMNRRKALIGIGSLAVGSGAALGSGAFTSVEADRDVTVETAGDSTAYLTLVGDDEYVSDDGSSGALTIDLGGATTNGFNEDAVTEVAGVVEITNNSGDGDPFTIGFDDGSGQTGSQTVSIGDGSGNAVADVTFYINTDPAYSASGSTPEIDSSTTAYIDAEVDTLNPSSPSGDTVTLTLLAQ